MLFPAGLVIKVVRTNANPAGNYMFKVNNRDTRTTPTPQESVVVFGTQFEDSVLENSIYVPFL